MRDIDLPSVPKFMVSFDQSSCLETPNIDSDGQPWFELGTIDFGETGKLLDTVKSNGAKILYATTWLESRIEEVLIRFFLGNEEDERYMFFKHEVLEASGFSFSFKKETCNKLVNQFSLLSGKDKEKLKKSMADIMKWRNAFAHGTLGYDGTKGCFIDFYQGGQQRLELDDVFWDNCERTFTTAHELMTKIMQTVSSALNK
ncbi:hypothetical protein [Photobacterium leiognathi]|uniref:hypothetical protein n=1 Tax=Photobacterium leiognathi TaxID=553611 RepID=UPI0027399980|nr:hypothetical protein [Photobacterium leiognathi]